MRSTLLIVMSIVLFATPTASAWERCEKRDGGARYTAALENEKRAQARLTRIIVCDARTGTERVLRRARLVGPRGTEIVDYSLSGRRLAWTERDLPRGRPSQATLTLRTVDVVTRRAGQRRVLRRGSTVRSTDAKVVVTARDDLLWSVGARLWSKVAGGTAVRRGTGRVSGVLFAGYTVVLRDGRPIDLRPRPLRDGCPHRRSVKTLGSTDRVRFGASRHTISFPSGPAIAVSLWWVCDRRTHRDAVVHQFGQEQPTDQAADSVRLAGIAGHFVLLNIETGFNTSRNAPELRLVDARTGATVRSVKAGEWPRPDLSAESVVLEDGSFAWVAADSVEPFAPRSVRLLRPGAEPVALDGAISGPTGLAASGRTLTWTNGGVARSYVLP